jgi:metallo-beta-lactamase family protein
MKITHLGAETCVTGSCHLIRFQPDHGGGSINILVDCGIAQGHDPQVTFDRFPVPPAEIDDLSWGFELYDPFICPGPDPGTDL